MMPEIYVSVDVSLRLVQEAQSLGLLIADLCPLVNIIKLTVMQSHLSPIGLLYGGPCRPTHPFPPKNLVVGWDTVYLI